MALTPGTRVGPYEVLSAIGAGGMGEVYRARDMRLNRHVAIKTLPAHVALDPERKARFDREAQLLAALNHPQIAGIHGLEQLDGMTCLVLELVEGQSLATRLSGGPLDLTESLHIARQIADALLAAHEKGIIHRDLKPANIMLTADGQVKVLDFGLAKIVEVDPPRDSSNSPTVTLGGTQVGMLLGTAAYMSPEQAKGLVADKRSDVWAFGCVLFEMLTGSRAFHGDDVSESLAAVLKSDPAWSTLPAGLPLAVHALIEGCLEKNRRARIADIAAAIFVLDRHHVLAPVTHPPGPAAGRQAPLWKRVLPHAATTVVVAALVSLAWMATRPAPAPQMPVRFVISLPDDQAFTNTTRSVVAVSPDGSRLVLAINNQLFVRMLGEITARPIPGTEDDPLGPVFSPDGRELAYWSGKDRGIKRIRVDGGVPVTLSPTMSALFGLNWSEAGLLVGLGPFGAVRLRDGAEPEQFLKVEKGEGAFFPQVLPDGRHVLFTLGVEGATSQDLWDKSRLVVHNLDTGVRTVLIEGNDGRYLPTGHLLFTIGGTVFAVPFDARQLKVNGSPVPVIEGVRRGITGVAHFDVSPAGVLVYVPGSSPGLSVPRGLAFADRKGNVEQLPLRAGTYDYPRASRDRRSIAFEISQPGGSNVWVYALAGGSSMRNLTLRGRNRYPTWSHDSERIAFQSDREGDLGIFAQRADGSGPAVRLTKPEKDVSHVPESWSPDGRHLLFSATQESTTTLMMLSLADGRVEPFAGIVSSRPTTAEFSPDGTWVAYSTSAGRSENFVYVRRFPPTDEVHQISKEGENGHHPMWTPAGDEILYVPQVGRFVAVKVSTRSGFSFSDPVAVPRRFAISNPATQRPWDIAPDGRILSIFDSSLTAEPEIRVVLNWFDELRARVPIK